MIKNKQVFAVDFARGKTRRIVSSLFCLSEWPTLVSCVPKKIKAIVLVSTMPDKYKIDRDTGLLEMILDCDPTKAVVDQINQNFHNYSLQKRTKRWSLAHFFIIADISSVAIYRAKFSQWE